MQLVSVRAGLRTLTRLAPELCSSLPHHRQKDALESIIIIYYYYYLPMVGPTSVGEETALGHSENLLTLLGLESRTHFLTNMLSSL